MKPVPQATGPRVLDAGRLQCRFRERPCISVSSSRTPAGLGAMKVYLQAADVFTEENGRLLTTLARFPATHRHTTGIEFVTAMTSERRDGVTSTPCT